MENISCTKNQRNEILGKINNLEDFKNFIKDKSVSVIGLGISNLPLIFFLKECGVTNLSARDKKDVFDEKTITHSAANVKKALDSMNAKIITGENYLAELCEDVIFKTPGIRRDLPEFLSAEKRGAIVTSEMELFLRICPAPIYAVTGSAGKTTTTTVIGEILEADGKTVHVGGNIGKPLLNEIENIKPTDYVVIELSSFQLADLADAPAPHKAVITNITPNHLDWHTDMEEYAEAKTNIFTNQTENDKVILNADDEISQKIIKDFSGKSKLTLFSQSEIKENAYTSVYLKNNIICVRENGEEREILDKKEISVMGEHNMFNFMTAIAVVYDEVSRESILGIARNFGGVEHRMEFVREKDGVKYYNSSIDSAPMRTVAALKSLEKDSTNNILLILGGYDKKLEYEPLLPYMQKQVKKAVVYGEAAEKILNALDIPEKKFALCKANFFDSAVKEVCSSAVSGDIVLLSPACASFGEFRNFEERGERFKELVKAL